MENTTILTDNDYYKSIELLFDNVSNKMRQSVVTILGLVSLLDEEEDVADIIQIMQFMKEPAQELNQCLIAITNFMQQHKQDT